MAGILIASTIVGAATGVVIGRIFLQRRGGKERILKEERDNDPYYISAFDRTRKECEALGAVVPDPSAICMQVQFKPEEELKNHVLTNSAWGRVSAVLYGLWNVHANGKLSHAYGVAIGSVTDLILNQDFYNSAHSYIAMPSVERTKSRKAPAIHLDDVSYHLVWHKGEWHLYGAAREYHRELVAIRIALAKGEKEHNFRK